MRTIGITFLLMVTMMVNAQNFYIAHRGASYDAPENTVASAKLAWEMGADAVEIDVYLAADNRVVVIHDKDTKRTCSGKNMTVKSTPSIVLRELDAGSWKDPKFKGERIPFIEEIIATVPEGKTLVVEVKCGSEIIPHLHRILEKEPKKRQIVFISFGWETIVDLKREFPENKAYWLSSSKNGLKKRMEQAVEAELDGVNLNHSIIDQEVMNDAKALNLEVLTWTVNDPAVAKRLMALGVTHFTTDRPGFLKQQLEP